MSDKKILIIDDEPYVIRSLSFVLKKDGFNIETAKDGVEAVQKAKTFRPNLVFLDLQIPKMDGFQVCRALRADPESDGCYIVLLTAKGEELDRRKGLEAGANEYMTKPFSPKELLDHIRELLGS